MYKRQVSDPNNRISKLVANEKDDRKVVEGVFLSILCRKPSESELKAGLRSLSGSDMADERAAVEAELAKFEKERLPARMAAWMKGVKTTTEWKSLEIETMSSSGSATLTKQADGSILASGTNPATDTFTFIAKTDLPNISGIRMEVLTDASLPAQGPGRAPNGNFVLTEIRAQYAIGAAAKQPLGLLAGTADFSQQGFSATSATDGKRNPKSGWAIAPQLGKSHLLVFETPETFTAGPGTSLTFTLDQEYGSQHTIGKLRFSVTNSPRPIRADEKIELPKPILDILTIDADKRTDAQNAELVKYYRAMDPEIERLTQAIAALKQQESQGRLSGAQDLAWALLNTPAFLFNR